jgi:hypothetical protein
VRIPRKLASTTVLAAALILGTTGPALADPSSPPPVTSIVALAAPDLQYLCGQFSVDYNATNPPNPLYCWYAVNPTSGAIGDTIETKNDPNCKIVRPDDSTAIIKQLQARLKTSSGGAYCVDLGFVTRNIKSSDGAGIVSVLFAKDLTTYSIYNGGNGVTNLTDTDLAAIYECNASLINSSYSGPVKWSEVGGTSTDAIEPVLPESFSDTRPGWLADIGVTTPGSCVVDGSYNGVAIAANEGTNPVFTAAGYPSGYKDVLFPFSGGSYVSQVYTKAIPNTTGALVLEDIDGKAPLTAADVINVTGTNAFPATYIHGEYAVTLNAGTATAPKVPVTPIDLTKLLGQGDKSGWICGASGTSTKAATDIKEFGFATTANCGALTGQ